MDRLELDPRATARMTAERQHPDQPADRPPGEGQVRVLVLNHRRDPCQDLLQALRDAGFDATESTSLAETRGRIPGTEADRPAVVVLNPLTLKADGVEAEMLGELQETGQRVSVIVLVEDVRALRSAGGLASMPFWDFVRKPYDTDELVHRVQQAARNRDAVQQLVDRNRDLEGQVSVDAKTGLASDRHFGRILQTEFGRARRHHLPLSMLLVDVDNFKGVNDTTEYAFGDEVLREVARALKESIRESDCAARFGGDEFVLLLPHTTPAEAVQTALRIRKTIAATVVKRDSYASQVTVSIGIDCYEGGSKVASPAELRTRANKALQEAKRQGKDRVWLYSEHTTPQRDASPS